MSSSKLKEDLNNCIITFDRRVVLTELLDTYDLAYEELYQVIEEHLKQQENKCKLKYEKRFLVHGFKVDGEENKKEIFKIVEEQKLKEWLQKLQNVESSLYSVEVAGGAKAAASVFKPIKVKEDVELKQSKTKQALDGKGEVAQTSKSNGSQDKVKEIKKETKNPFQETPASKSIKDTPKSSNNPVTPVKKPSPKVESSPSVKKSADKKAATNKKGGINSFFAPATTKKTDVEPKDNKSIVKPPTPKKMQDYFKKQTEKPKTPTESLTKSTANNNPNNSIQLFDSEDEAAEVSSDEEEKIEALKRDIISSDVEMDAVEDEETDNKPSTSVKRRRILDSDDEDEDPPIKQEKLDIKEEANEEEEIAEPETYLDEEGFVITKKPKQKSTATKSSSSAAIKTTPAVTIKTSPKENKKSSPSNTSKDKKAAANDAAKTKQANIMSFFKKK